MIVWATNGKTPIHGNGKLLEISHLYWEYPIDIGQPLLQGKWEHHL